MRALAFRHVLDHSASCLAAAHAPLPPPDEDEDEDDDASEASSQAPSVDGLVRLAEAPEEEDPLEDLCAGKFFFQWQIAGFCGHWSPILNFLLSDIFRRHARAGSGINPGVGLGKRSAAGVAPSCKRQGLDEDVHHGLSALTEMDACGSP